jgi:sterol desaturase/sphingolipid hydroxylase (fatty acid hydroxylase superfamily)
MRALARAGFFPLVLGGIVLASAQALEAGGDLLLVSSAATFVAAALVFLGERALPYEPTWRRSRGDVLADVCHLVFSNAAAGLFALGVAALLGRVSLPRLAGITPWPASWPLYAQLALSWPLTELAGYWFHRLCHVWPPLWRLHSVHHSAPRVYWLNIARFHPIDGGLAAVASSAPLLLLGADERLLVLAGVLARSFGLLQHGNVDVRLGPLNHLFSMAEVHRWHHSRRMDEANANYGNMLLLWDVLFGSRFYPTDRRPPVDVGIDAPAEYPTSYLGQLAAPFRRALWSPAGPRAPTVRRS